MKKFKFTYGHGVIVALAAFMIFILYFVFNVSFSDDSFDLVEDDYYAQELVFQDSIDATKNAANMENKPEIKMEAYGIGIIFSEGKNIDDKSKMSAKLYRPNSQALDLEQNTSNLSENKTILFPKDKLKEGYYKLILRWNFENKNYEIEKSIYWKEE